MKVLFSLFLLLLLSEQTTGQELFVSTEPASNMPAGSVELKYAGKFIEGYHSNKLEQRHMLEFHASPGKRLMVNVGTTISDMYSYPVIRWESARIYAKYRFYSNDEVHRHFRAAAFLEGSYSVNEPYYDEISFDGDQSGVRGGIILTQLLHKLAVSSTLSVSQVLQPERWEEGPSPYSFQSFNYSLSGGYLLFPRSYNSYEQTNINLYFEVLGSSNIGNNKYFLDMAPAIQFIFNSNTKLNFAYRFQVNGNMHRMAMNSYQVSVDRTFLNAFKKRR